jgi:chorismate synthase
VRSLADPLIEKGAEAIYQTADKSEVRCINPELSAKMREEIKERRKEGTSLGGIYEIVVTGLPAGLGSYVHWDRKLDGQLAQAIVSTQAMKGVEIGLGFDAGKTHGHNVHDEIMHNGTDFKRRTNRAGGIEGGMTTGMPIILRGVMKPIPTMIKPLRTADVETKLEQETRYERSDVCALPRAVVVAESVIAPVLANAVLEKFGGDSMDEILERYRKRERNHGNRQSNKIRELAGYLKKNPNDSFTKFALALELLSLNDVSKAQGLFESVLKQDPDYLGVYYHLGQII